MRTLKFIVDGQVIKPDPECDFGGLVPGTEGYLQAEFSFSKEWDGCAKVVAFYSLLGKEYPPQVLKDGKICVIPSEALKRRVFTVQVLGRKRGMKLSTNKAAVSQNGGKT
jgi:hypothetical protein